MKSLAEPTASPPEHFLSADSWDTDRIKRLLLRASRLRNGRPQQYGSMMSGRILANLFFEPSTRTRLSFGAAFMRLGGQVLDTTSMQFSSVAKGESLQDTARVVSGYVDAITIRHPDKGSAAEFAQGATVPVINAGDGDGEHPTQALLDLYTIRSELKRLHDLHVVVVGDLKFGRTVHSLLRMLSRFSNVSVTAAAPEILSLPEGLTDDLADRLDIERTTDLDSALPEADVVYVTRTQTERHPGSMMPAVTEQFAFTADKLSLCKPEARILHPLPRNSAGDNCELDPAVDKDERVAIFRQADNGIPVRMALFWELLGGASQEMLDRRILH